MAPGSDDPHVRPVLLGPARLPVRPLHGNQEVRAALRDALEGTTNLPAAHGVFNMSAKDHLGLDQRARVMVKVDGGTWKLVK